MHTCGRVPIKLYLQEQVVGRTASPPRTLASRFPSIFRTHLASAEGVSGDSVLPEMPQGWGDRAGLCLGRDLRLRVAGALTQCPAEVVWSPPLRGFRAACGPAFAQVFVLCRDPFSAVCQLVRAGNSWLRGLSYFPGVRTVSSRTPSRCSCLLSWLCVLAPCSRRHHDDGAS